VEGGRLKIVNLKFEKRKKLCGLGVSAVKKVYRRGAETLRGFCWQMGDRRWEMGGSFTFRFTFTKA
jgi:hypothetical protein